MKFIINDDKIEIDTSKAINSGSVNYYNIECEFNSAWDNLTKEIILKKEGAKKGIKRVVVDGVANIDTQINGMYSIGAKGYSISYTLTTDTEVDTTKTYYTRSGSEGSYIYTKVTNPVASELSTYYEAETTLQISTGLKRLPVNIGAGEIEVGDESIDTTEWQAYIHQIQAVVTQASNINVTGARVSDGVEITFTSKTGTQTVQKVNDGEGLMAGGTTGQVLKKKSNTDFDTEWADDTNTGVQDVKVDGTSVVTENVANIDLTGYATEEEITELETELGNKVDKITGKGLSTNDYTTEEKNKLAGIEEGATKVEKTSDITNDSNFPVDSNYVHTDNNYTTTEKNKLAGLSNYDDTEVRGLISANATDIDTIEGKIPNQATSENQLADKEFVNSTVGTNTANYIYKTVGTEKVPFDSVAELEAYTGTVTNNDYAFITGTDSSGNTFYDRYKATVSGSTITWAKEYRLNNSSFTSTQWTAIQSGITALLVAQITTNKDDISAIKNGQNIDSFGDVETEFENKVDKVTGKGLSTEDYTSAEKTKLSGIESGANKTTVDSSLLSTSENPVQNKVVKQAVDSINEDITNLTAEVRSMGHVYGVKRARNNNSSSAWERTDDSVGLVANATKNGSAVANDFDKLSPWKDIISINLDLSTKKVNAFYGESNFSFDGSNGDVYTRYPDIYYKIWQDENYDYIQIADYARTGFIKCSSFDIARYKNGIVNNQLRSYTGLIPAYSRTLPAFRTLAQSLGSEFCLLDWRYFVLQILYLVEYADYNTQNILGNGYTSMRYNSSDKALIAESSTNRIVINTSGGNAFIVGQEIAIGSSVDSFSVAGGRKITAIADYSDGTVTGKAITFDGSAVNIAVNNVIWSSPQASGGCDSLGMKSGCLANDGKHAMIYRGIENWFGNIYEWIDGLNFKDYQAWVCYEPANYVSDKFESPYTKLGYVDVNTAGYAKTLGFDSDNPLVRFPTEVGGGSNTYMSDYHYTNSGNRVALVGGVLHHGSYAGAWFWSLYNGSSVAGWYIGCRVLKYQ